LAIATRKRPVLIMLEYSFHPGPNAAKSLQRFIQWTPPEGFETKQVWMATSHGGYLLAEVSGAGPILEVTAQYADVAAFKIQTVVEAADGVPLLQRGFEYGAAH
jgi:hypothetical protein